MRLVAKQPQNLCNISYRLNFLDFYISATLQKLKYDIHTKSPLESY